MRFEYPGRRGPTIVLRHGLPEASVESIGLTGIVGTEDAVWVSDWAGNAVYGIPLAKLAQ
jgi:hypothetical protein